MSYAIVGFGKIGQVLAHAFARKNINVTVASRRPPGALAPQARAIGPTVVARSLQDALEADTIILAVPFGEHREVAKAMPSWKGNPSLPVLRHTPALSRTHVFPRGSVHSLLGDFRSQPSLNLRAGRDAFCRTHCGVQSVPNHHYYLG